MWFFWFFTFYSDSASACCVAYSQILGLTLYVWHFLQIQKSIKTNSVDWVKLLLGKCLIGFVDYQQPINLPIIKPMTCNTAWQKHPQEKGPPQPSLHSQDSPWYSVPSWSLRTIFRLAFLTTTKDSVFEGILNFLASKISVPKFWDSASPRVTVTDFEFFYENSWLRLKAQKEAEKETRYVMLSLLSF